MEKNESGVIPVDAIKKAEQIEKRQDRELKDEEYVLKPTSVTKKRHPEDRMAFLLSFDEWNYSMAFLIRMP